MVGGGKGKVSRGETGAEAVADGVATVDGDGLPVEDGTVVDGGLGEGGWEAGGGGFGGEGKSEAGGGGIELDLGRSID